MTPELFMQWKNKKISERDAGLAAQQADRAKNDRMRYNLPPPLSLSKGKGYHLAKRQVISKFYVIC